MKKKYCAVSVRIISSVSDDIVRTSNQYDAGGWFGKDIFF